MPSIDREHRLLTIKERLDKAERRAAKLETALEKIRDTARYGGSRGYIVKLAEEALKGGS